MPQRHREDRVKEESKRAGSCATVRQGADEKEEDGFGETFMNNDRKKRSEKQLSVRTDLEQLYL